MIKRLKFGSFVVFTIIILLGCGDKEQEVIVEPVAPEVKPIEVQPDLINNIAEIVKNGNEKLPMMVDKQTRLDKVVAGPGAQITYLYTLPDYASFDVSADWISTDVKPKVTKDVCDTAVLRKLLASGVTLVYAYKGKDEVDINKFQVQDFNCKQIGF